MPRLTSGYYWREEDIPAKEQAFRQGFALIEEHKLFKHLDGEIFIKPNKEYGKNGLAVVEKNGKISVNTSLSRTPQEWAYIIAHCLLHLAFGHYDDNKIPKMTTADMTPSSGILPAISILPDFYTISLSANPSAMTLPMNTASN